MFNQRRNLALLTLLISTAASIPTVSLNAAQAQIFPNNRRNSPYSNPNNRQNSPYYPPNERQNSPYYNENSYGPIIATGTTIPVMYDEAEKILVTQDETVPITLKVAANLKNRYGEILVPYGSEIKGQIEPTNGGSHFVADRLIIQQGDQEIEKYIEATSRVVSRTEVVERGADTEDILKGAAIGGAAATVISILTGANIDAIEVIGGAGLGALAGLILGDGEAELISIDPNQDLDLTLNADLALR